jgi:hypothetical protein
MSAGLEYENGTNANVDNGMWLHQQVTSLSISFLDL